MNDAALDRLVGLRCASMNCNVVFCAGHGMQVLCVKCHARQIQPTLPKAWFEEEVK